MGVLTGKPDGKIDENDKTDIGNPHPDFTYGLNINVGYKNWDFAESMNYRKHPLG